MSNVDIRTNTSDEPDSAPKLCCMCGLDVSTLKRKRDSSDRYWCESCTKLEVRERPALGVVVCPDCGVTGAKLVSQDSANVCEPCAVIRRQEIADSVERRRKKTHDPELRLRRIGTLLVFGIFIFATLMVLRYTAWPLKFAGYVDDWLNVVAIVLPMPGIAAIYVAIVLRRKMRLMEYDSLIVRTENGMMALAERHNQTHSVVERTEGQRQHVRRVIRRIEAAAGRDIAKADRLIEQFDLLHETRQIVTFLSSQRPGTHDLVARNREIETVAYLGADNETAMNSIIAVLSRIPGELDGMTRQAMILCATSRFDLAKKLFNRVINLAMQKEDQLAVADGFANLGLAHQLLNEVDDAHRFHNKALFMYKTLPGNEDREADCYGNIGFIHHQRGEKRDAELVFRKALSINTSLKRVEGMALDYGVLGLMVYNNEEGVLREAEQMLNQAISLNQRLARFGAVAAAYGNLGLVKAKNKDFKRARQMLNESLAIYRRLNRQKMVAKVQIMLVQLDKTSPAR